MDNIGFLRLSSLNVRIVMVGCLSEGLWNVVWDVCLVCWLYGCYFVWFLFGVCVCFLVVVVLLIIVELFFVVVEVVVDSLFLLIVFLDFENKFVDLILVIL